MTNDIQQRAMQWIAGRGVGVSSKTIWSVMMGVNPDSADIPHDSDDFSRCYQLLKLIPEWQERMSGVATVYPKWTPLIERWDEMMANFQRGHTNRVDEWLRNLRAACMEADGYEKTGPSSWRKGSDFSTELASGKHGAITFSGVSK